MFGEFFVYGNVVIVIIFLIIFWVIYSVGILIFRLVIIWSCVGELVYFIWERILIVILVEVVLRRI